MADNITNELMYETLKEMQAQLSGLKTGQGEILRRLSNIETASARLGRDHAQTYTDVVEDRHAVDAISQRLERIERRLELND